MAYLDIAKRAEAKYSGYEKNEINERIPAGPAHTWGQLLATAFREPDPRCRRCGQPAGIIRATGEWECDSCTGLAIPDPPWNSEQAMVDAMRAAELEGTALAGEALLAARRMQGSEPGTEAGDTALAAYRRHVAAIRRWVRDTWPILPGVVEQVDLALRRCIEALMGNEP